MAQELVEVKQSAKGEAEGDVQAHLASLRSALNEPIASLDALLELLHAPLDLLDRLLPTSRVEKYTWKRFTGLEPSVEARIAALRAAWLADVQTAIVTRIAVDWSEALQAEGLWEDLLIAWFCARSTKPSSLVREVGGSAEEVDVTAGKLQLATLRNLPALLSQKPQHANTTDALKLVLSSLPQALDLTLIAAAATNESGVARATLTWEEAVRNLCGLRARVANWAQGDVIKQWESSPHAELFGTQLERLVQAISEASPAPKNALATLVSKLLRTGYLSSDSELWPALLAAILRRAQPTWSQRYTASWHQAISSLSRSDTVALLHNLLSVLDQRLSKHSSSLYTAAEARSSTEGESFLSGTAAEARRGALALLELFACSRSSPSTDADPGSEDEEESLSEVLVELAFGSGARRGTGVAWRPATAVVLSQLAHKSGCALSLAKKAIQTWGDTKRIPQDTFERALYLTTLVLTLPLPTPHDAALLNGVSAHLEHLDTAVRRLGMLVAELVSAQAAATSTAPEAERSRPLSFGVSIWQGLGEGKSEARALRQVRAQKMEVEDGPGAVAAERLGLLPQVETAIAPPSSSLPSRPARKAPKTRKLPQRQPPSAAEPRISLFNEPLQATSRRGGALITELDSAAPSSSHAVVATSGELQALVSRESESEESTSSESDSSESDEDEALAGLEGLGLGKDDIASAQAAAGVGVGAAGGQKAGKDKDEEQFGMAVPKKKRRRTPIYVGELAPLLRENERDANRMGLKFAEALLRRKRGWGGEVDENAVDLSYALCGMQNNFSLKHFEDRRVAALAAVIAASPRLAAPAVIEQYFHHQCSITQRVAILIALAMAARELAGLAPLPTSAGAQAVEDAAEGLAKAAVGRAKAEGEARVPAIAREKALSLGKSGRAVASTSHAPLAGAVVRPQERYADLAPNFFLMPLLNRLWATLDEGGARARVAAGAGTLLSPSLVARLLDTLAVLAHAARHASSFLAIVVPELLELVLGISRRPLAHAEDAGAPHDDGRSAVAGAAASLALVILDAAWELDGGRTLLRHNAALVLDLTDWAEAIFTEEDAKGGVAAAMGRAGRSSAAVLLRVHEIREVGAQR